MGKGVRMVSHVREEHDQDMLCVLGVGVGVGRAVCARQADGEHVREGHAHEGALSSVSFAYSPALLSRAAAVQDSSLSNNRSKQHALPTQIDRHKRPYVNRAASD